MHWHKDKKNLQTLTIQFGGVKTCLFSSAFSNQGLCWNRWWKLNRQQRNRSFYSSRKFGPLFLVQTYQRCVYNKNAKAVSGFLVSHKQLSKTWDSFSDLGSSTTSNKEEETQLFTQHLPQELKIAVIQHTQSHHCHQKMTFSEKKCPQRQFHYLRTHANAEQWNSIWLSKNQTCMTISQTVLFN